MGWKNFFRRYCVGIFNSNTDCNYTYQFIYYKLYKKKAITEKKETLILIKKDKNYS